MDEQIQKPRANKTSHIEQRVKVKKESKDSNVPVDLNISKIDEVFPKPPPPSQDTKNENEK